MPRRIAKPFIRLSMAPFQLRTPSHALRSRSLSSSSLSAGRRPVDHSRSTSRSTAVQLGTLAAGATAGGWAGGHAHSFRLYSGRPLRCEEQKEEPSLLERLHKNIGLPSLPAVPTSFSLPSIALPDFGVGDTLSKWKGSLATVSTAFTNLQSELSLGPDSTYAHILNDAKNARVHPEIQWDAKVRLGRDLPHTERAYLRNRREHMRDKFARLMGVPVEDVDERDLPVVAIAASGGGYRAMINTTATLQAAKESGLLDTVTYMSAVSGSCWALNTLYSVGGGDLDWTLRHLRERVKEPFLAPETFVKLFSTDDEASRLLLSAAILKRSSQGGELSLPDVYGTLVSSRLYVADEGAKSPRPLSLATLKTSTQRQYMDDGSHPLPIYTTVRHDLPTPEELAELEKRNASKGLQSSKGDSAGSDTNGMASKASWTWFETTPYEVGSDKLGAFVPTWSLGRVFDNGKSTERVPELGVPVLSGIYASAFCASLFSYFLEIKPLLVALPYFSVIDDFGEPSSRLVPGQSLSISCPAVKSNAHKLDAIHPFPPAELPNFLYGLETPSDSSDIPKALTEARTLGFADAGVELNLPYVPLLRRSVDVIIALDSSADSHDVWFTRAAEYAESYEADSKGSAIASAEKHERKSRWPAVDVKSLFPEAGDTASTVEVKEHEKDPKQAARRVDQAKQQEDDTIQGSEDERGGVRSSNPQPTPLGSAPESREKAEAHVGDKPMPESQQSEPPLSKCSIWIGSTRDEDAASCRNDNPSVEAVAKRDGIALAYIPLSPDDDFENPLEVFSTWKFDYTEDETDRLIRLAKGERSVDDDLECRRN